MIVFLKRGAAPRCVGDDGANVLERESHEVLAGEISRGVADSRVSSERAATKLRCGDDDFTAVCGEDADGRFVEAREGDLGDAAGEEGYAGAARAGGGKRAAKLAKKERIIDGRQKAFAAGQAEEFEYAAGAGQGLQARPLIETKNA